MPRPEPSCSMSRDHLASAAQVAANAPAIGFLRHPSSPDRGRGLGTHTVRGNSGWKDSDANLASARELSLGPADS
jgi:hypothetical protein